MKIKYLKTKMKVEIICMYSQTEVISFKSIVEQPITFIVFGTHAQMKWLYQELK